MAVDPGYFGLSGFAFPWIVVPAVGDVAQGVAYGPGGALTGTLDAEGGGSPPDPGDSVYDDVLSQSTFLANSLGLTVGGEAFVVGKRKLPKAEEELDALPFLAIVPAEYQGRRRPWQTAGSDGIATVRVDNRFQIVAVMKGRREPAANMEDVSDWRQVVMRVFGPPRPLIAVEAFEVEVNPDVWIDRSLYSKLYEYSAIEINLVTIEPARNPDT